MYNLFLRDDQDRHRLAHVLAALLSVTTDDVDIADDGVDDRNWAAAVSCTVSPVAGDVRSHLDIYVDDSVAGRPTEPEAAAWLARNLQTLVLYSGEELLPSAHWLVGPDGHRTRARVVEDGEGDPPTYQIQAVEASVGTLPDVPVMPLPEVIREHRVPTPVTDRLHDLLQRWPDVCTRLGAWEALVARMAAEWPPDGWYPAAYYKEDLEYRDELASAAQQLPDAVRTQFVTALDEIDGTYAALTDDDAGASLAAELGTATVAANGWWWRRVPQPVPWLRQPGREL